MSDKNFEQRLCFKLRYSATEMFQKLQEAYGYSVLTGDLRWFEAYSESGKSIEDRPCCTGRPSNANHDENN